MSAASPETGQGAFYSLIRMFTDLDVQRVTLAPVIKNRALLILEAVPGERLEENRKPVEISEQSKSPSFSDEP